VVTIQVYCKLGGVAGKHQRLF